MAAARPVQGLQEEATCSICLEYYTDPVTTKCGHNFCRSCIRGCSEGAGKALPCPQCRQLCPEGELSINRQLQSIVEFVKQLSVQLERPPGEGLCEEHEEKLKLFCEEDERLICVICQLSSDHEQHKVRPVKEAVQKYKHELQEILKPLREQMGVIQKCKLKEEAVSRTLRHELQDILKPLREQMGVIQKCKLKEEEVSRTLRNKLEEERRKIETEFEKLRQTLKEQEQTLLRRLEEMNEKIMTIERLKMAKLSAEITCLKELITEIEEKCGQPAGEFLKDIRSTLSRCKHVIMDPTPGQIKQLYKELLTLDEDTAHGELALSEGGRRARRTGRDQRRPSNPRRFTGSWSVLGKEGFTSGRHYWELQLLQEGGGWAVGVAQESVDRSFSGIESPEKGFWAVYKDDDGQYRALTSPPSPLSPRQRPLRLGLYLDYEGGRLSIYNADTLEELFTFTGAAFSGRVCPYFWLWFGADLRLV